MKKDGRSEPQGGPRGLLSDVPLAPLTSLGLGGEARHMMVVETVDDVVEAVRWARQGSEFIAVLGGGTNLVVADTGFGGLVLRTAIPGVEFTRDGDEILVAAGAGVVWDELVAEAVERGLAGLECLSGIPGLVGATPIQNVGAYGQEVGEVVESLRVIDLETLDHFAMPGAACGFGYRSSIFRKSPGRYFVLEVTYRLRPGGAPVLTYEELRRVMAMRDSSPTLREVRDTVLALRRSKSMVLDADNPDCRSAGSFFVNPVVETVDLHEMSRRGRASGVLEDEEIIPSFDIGEGRFKVPAGWLIERAGFAKGLFRGAVGISSAHALALVHHGGGTAAQLVALAREIRAGVRQTFGITLRPEPVFLGFPTSNPLDGQTFDR